MPLRYAAILRVDFRYAMLITLPDYAADVFAMLITLYASDAATAQPFSLMLASLAAVFFAVIADAFSFSFAMIDCRHCRRCFLRDAMLLRRYADYCRLRHAATLFRILPLSLRLFRQPLDADYFLPTCAAAATLYDAAL